MVLDLAAGALNVTKLKSRELMVGYTAELGKDLPSLAKRTGSTEPVDELGDRDFKPPPPQPKSQAETSAGPQDVDLEGLLSNQDVALFAPAVQRVASRLAGAAGTTSEPDAHGEGVAHRLCPATLPYVLGTEAGLDAAGFNGRPLARDAFDVVLTLGANRPPADGVAPPADRISNQYPYFGQPYTKAEQSSLQPISMGFEA